MKKGYHSKQMKVFGKIPRSQFLGIALGYAAGLILQGITKNTSNVLLLAGLAGGYVIGYLIDRFLFLEPDDIRNEMKADHPGEMIIEYKEIDLEQ